MNVKHKIIATFIVCVLILGAVSLISGFWNRQQSETGLKVGFICSEDESTPYTYNFLQAQYKLKELYGDKIQVLVRSNVHQNAAEESMRDLVRNGCSILFIN